MCTKGTVFLFAEYNTKLSLKNGRIKNLPTSWDDISRQYSRSWKDCTKKKHRYK